MTEKKPLFRYVDEVVFKQINVLKQSQPYAEAMRQLNNLSDLQLKVINQVTSLLLITIPLVILLIVFIMNVSFNASLDTKRDILSEINSFTSAQKQLAVVGKNIISGTGLVSRGQFSKYVTGSISTVGANTSTIRITSFESSSKDGIIKSNGTVKFSKLSTETLTLFLADLVDRNKFHVSNIKIEKKLKDNIVKGQVQLLHYGRAPEAKK